MKKIFALLAVISSTAFAGSTATLEYQNIDVRPVGANDAKQYSLGVKHDFDKNFAGDVGFSTTVTDTTKTLSNRVEVGVTGSVPLTGSVGFYTRGAVGKQFNNGSNFNFYSVEPGVAASLGNGVTATVGYKYNAAFDEAINDTTRTLRAGVSYDVTKNDVVGVRYDRQRGDSESNTWAVNYSRKF